MLVTITDWADVPGSGVTMGDQLTGARPLLINTDTRQMETPLGSKNKLENSHRENHFKCISVLADGPAVMDAA